ncbi:MAG: GWxTD domain-containing protein [Acidobacteria bacterium]|nr:GWxTD domain-containing protein [Acidobacteriota bacterium]
MSGVLSWRPGALGLLLALWGTPCLSAITSPQQERSEWNRPVPEWYQGPVRYALTDAETKTYRSLSQTLERAAFIARFWASRDPDPRTPRNEAEEVFWQRVFAANELFKATTLAGWRTDRGRIYIILGPPDEISSYNTPSVAQLDPTHFQDGLKRGPESDLRLGQRGAVEWIYRSLPSRLADAGQNVTFVKDESGEFRLSSRLAPSFRFEIDTLVKLNEPPPPNADRRLLVQAISPTQSPNYKANAFEGNVRSAEDLFSWGQTSLFQKMEPNASGPGRVSAAEYFGVIPVRHQLAFFQGVAGTSTLLTLGVPLDMPADSGGATPPTEVEIFGTLEKVSDPAHSYQFSSKRKLSDSAPTQMVSGVEHRLIEIRGVVPPGEYRVNFGARLGERVGTAGETVVIPDFQPDTLSLAGPVLAEQVGQHEPDGGNAFVLGKIKMIPKLDSSYAPESNFGFYFQVYHARLSPNDTRLHLNIEYSVAVREKGVFRPLGKPVSLKDNPAPNHAYWVPLKGWSPGEYLLTVTVGDGVGGEVVTGIAVFRVQ